ncbi:MAG: hypothetical protein WBZ54_13255, partial [Methylocella sp.]
GQSSPVEGRRLGEEDFTEIRPQMGRDVFEKNWFPVGYDVVFRMGRGVVAVGSGGVILPRQGQEGEKNFSGINGRRRSTKPKASAVSGAALARKGRVAAARNQILCNLDTAMKKEKIYEFAIDRPLTPAKRKAVEKHIEHNAHLSPKPVSYNWDEDDDEVLHIAIEPVLIEVRFQDKKVELYGAAPLWARILFTKKRKGEIKDQIESVLHKAKFVAARKSKNKTTNGDKSPEATRRKRSAS